MPGFTSYNTTDSRTGDAPLVANQAISPLLIKAPITALIAGTIASDQSGSLIIDQSFDGINFDGTPTVISVTANVGQTFTVNVKAPTTRLTYKNGNTAQTYLRLFARAIGNRKP